MTASYGKTIVTASSHSESKLELKPPAVKNKHRIITSANLWRLWIGYSYLLQYKKKGKWGNVLAQDELYYPWNNFCLAASITPANIISRQVVVMLARMTKMLHFSASCPSPTLPYFPPEEPLVLRALGWMQHIQMYIPATSPSWRFHLKQLLWIRLIILAKNKQI